jgi:PAS domain S-box-containing protein
VGDLLAISSWRRRARRRAARTSPEDRPLVESLVDSLPLGVYVVDRDYRVRLWNRKREAGTEGVAREEAIGREIFEVLPRQDAALMRREFDEAFVTGQLQQLQVESRSTGETRTTGSPRSRCASTATGR